MRFRKRAKIIKLRTKCMKKPHCIEDEAFKIFHKNLKKLNEVDQAFEENPITSSLMYKDDVYPKCMKPKS